MIRSALKSFIVGAAMTVPLASPVGAATILLHDIGGAAQVTGTAAEAGFKIAAKYWESVLTNNATIELNVGYGGLPPGVLGATSSTLVEFVPIGAYLDALNFTATSALDFMAVATRSPLNGNDGVSALVPSYLDPSTNSGINVAGGTRLAPDDVINTTLALTSANFKAFGIDLGPSFIDGSIQFSNQLAFDFNPLDGIQAGHADFIGVAIHEIGHALGFVSGADDFDYFNGNAGQVDAAWWAYGLDMFRYSAPGQLNWAPNQPSYFSVDGGVTALAGGYFSTGENTGDGNQASHWKQPDPATPCDDFLGVMNPYICGGKMDSVTALDLAALDAIGWNLNVDVLAKPDYAMTTAQIYLQFRAPEPTTASVALLALCAAGLATRRRLRR